MIRRPPRSTLSSSSAASDVYKRQDHHRAAERDQLLDSEGVRAEHGPGVDLEPELGELLGGLPAHRRPVDASAPPRLVAEHDVLGDGEVLAEVDLLVDRADAGLLGMCRTAEHPRLPADKDLSLIHISE